MPTQDYKVFVTQTYLQIKFDCKNTDISTGTVVTAVVDYEDPDKETGTYPATISGTVVTLSFYNTAILKPGDWNFQPIITIDGLIAPCQPVKIKFTNRLKNT